MAFTIFTHSEYILEVSRYLKKGFEKGRKVVKLKKKLGMRTKKRNFLEQKHYRKLFFSVLLAVGSLMFFIKMYSFEKNGIEAATTILSKIEHKKVYRTVRFEGSGDAENIAFLYCGARNCAGLNTVTNNIIYFPQNGPIYHVAAKAQESVESSATQ